MIGEPCERLDIYVEGVEDSERENKRHAESVKLGSTTEQRQEVNEPDC